MRLAITGAHGFLGGHLMAEATRRGHQAVAIPLKDRLGEPDVQALVGLLAPARQCNAIINCAAAVKPRTPVDHFLNARAPQVMASVMHESRGRFMHISTLNAIIPKLRDPYSLAKRAAEETFAKADVTIIRPGLIWSWAGEGSSAVIEKYLKIPLPVYPMLYPGNVYFPLNADAVAKAICDILENENATGRTFNFYGDMELSLWNLVKIMADRSGRTLLRVPGAVFRGLALGFAENLFCGNQTTQQLLNLRRRGKQPGMREKDLILPFTIPSGPGSTPAKEHIPQPSSQLLASGIHPKDRPGRLGSVSSPD